MKQGLIQEQKLVQKLSPQQIQMIKLLELPVQEFEQRVRSELEENPVLDEDTRRKDEEGNVREGEEEQPKDISLDEYKDDDYIPAYKLKVNNWGKDEKPQYNTFSVKEGFTQSLMEQLGYRELDPHEEKVAAFLIGSLDDDGYLRRPISDIVDDMAFRAGIETTDEEAERMLGVIQEFEPTGVGARDLQECILIQLKAKKSTPARQLAIAIVENYWKEFSSKHFSKIMAKEGVESEEIKAAMEQIVKINPHPGGQIDDSYNDQAQQIIPDFLLTYDGTNFDLSMPRFTIPEVRVNKKYAEMMLQAASGSDREQKEAALFVKKKLDSAKWFVEAIKQRHNTLMTTMNAILDYQREFFIDGDETHLRPMVLKDIAEKTGYDISTISRVVNSKYIETHFGILSLKYFFSEGLENKDGEEVSTREIKKVLLESIGAEDKQHPVTDDQLVKILGEKGYKVARRTIAKYRDQLSIPKACLRKDI